MNRLRAQGSVRAMTAADLRRAEHEYRLAFGRSEQKREARNAAIRAAVANGMRQAQVAQITGLHRARIGQIIGQRKVD
jgi:hypothetical protein